jgi:hypothetical protein
VDRASQVHRRWHHSSRLAQQPLQGQEAPIRE